MAINNIVVVDDETGQDTESLRQICSFIKRFLESSAKRRGEIIEIMRNYIDENNSKSDREALEFFERLYIVTVQEDLLQ